MLLNFVTTSNDNSLVNFNARSSNGALKSKINSKPILSVFKKQEIKL